MEHAVEVQLRGEQDGFASQRGYAHCDDPPPPTPRSRSPSPSRPGTVFVVPLDDLVEMIAADEIASNSGAGVKRAAEDSGSEGSPADQPKKKKKRAKTAEAKRASKQGSKRRKRAKAREQAAAGELPARRPGFASHGAKPGVEYPAIKVAQHAFNVDRWGYCAVNGKSIKQEPWTVADLDAEGVRYIEWDGRTTQVILDAKRRIVAVLLARPQEKPGPDGKTSWEACMGRLAALFERIRSKHDGDWKGDDCDGGRRGDFTSFGFGSSYGGGQALPGELVKKGWEADVQRELRENADLQRLSSWGSEGFASFFPKAYAFAAGIMQQLYDSGDATRNMPRSVYAAATCNLGPKTVCFDHTDHLNYPGIPCVITAFGDYDADEGGNLFLLNFGLRIRFPPGATAILSSAGVRHGNTAIPEGQRRYSYTQYTAGGLVRWVTNGFRRVTGMSTAARVKLAGPPGSDWEAQLARLSVYEQLPKDRAALVAAGL